LLRDTQQQADGLRQRLAAAEGRTMSLLRDNIAFKQQLGLPTEAEEEQLAALQAGGGSSSGPDAHTGAGAILEAPAPAQPMLATADGIEAAGDATAGWTEHDVEKEQSSDELSESATSAGEGEASWARVSRRKRRSSTGAKT
jgi:hypothetical protein